MPVAGFDSITHSQTRGHARMVSSASADADAQHTKKEKEGIVSPSFCDPTHTEAGVRVQERYIRDIERRIDFNLKIEVKKSPTKKRDRNHKKKN